MSDQKFFLKKALILFIFVLSVVVGCGGGSNNQQTSISKTPVKSDTEKIPQTDNENIDCKAKGDDHFNNDRNAPDNRCEGNITDGWEKVGVLEQGILDMTLFVDGNTPYIAFRDKKNDKQITVQKYENNSWNSVGETSYKFYGFDSGSDLSLQVDKGIVYLAYITHRLLGKNNGGNGRIIKYENDTWSKIVDTTDTHLESVDLMIVNGEPRMAYKWNRKLRTKTISYAGIIQKDTDSQWQSERIYYPILLNYGDVSLSVIDDISYASYVAADWSNESKANVVRYNAGEAENITYIGKKEFSSAQGTEVIGTSLYNEEGIFYIALSEFITWLQTELTVMRYENNQWVTVGKPRFTSGDAPSIVVRNGIPYIFFIKGNKPAVMKFNGTNWINVGNQSSLTEAIEDAESISGFISEEGTLYVAIEDSLNYQKGVVMKFKD